MRRIIVENFGPIEHLDLNIPDFLLLTGQQASGKSTLAKLIYFFETIGEQMVGQFFPLSHINNNNIIEYYRNNLVNNFQKYAEALSGGKLFNITYYYNDKDFIGFKASPNNSLNQYSINVNFSESVLLLIDNTKAIYNKQTEDLNEGITEMDRLRMEFTIPYSLQYLVRNLYSSPNQIRYIIESRADYTNKFLTSLKLENEPAGVNLILKQSAAIFFDLLDQNLERKNFQLNNELFERIIKAQYVVDGKSRLLVVNGEVSIPVNDGSSGQREALYILVYLSYIKAQKSYPYTIIEEPESHLHPLSQKELLKAIGAAHIEFNGKTVITTHSPYIVAAFSLLMLQNTNPKEDLASRKRKFGAFELVEGKLVDLVDWEMNMVSLQELDKAGEELSIEMDKVIFSDESKSDE